MLCSLLCYGLVFALTLASNAVNCSAKSAILIEADSGEVIYEKNAYEMLPMASTTKIMTALVAIEKCDLNKIVKIPAEAVGIEGSSLYLKEGEEFSMLQLLYGLMLQSANDAAVAIAIDCAGSVESFAQLMNDKASELGLKNSHFTNPNGLDDEGHYTTAFDLAYITSYALKNETFKKIVSTYKYDIGDKVVVNHNKLLQTYDGAYGVKTGFTKKCGRCLVSAAERDGVNLICVTLCDGDDWNDHASLLDYGFSLYKNVKLCDAGSLVYELPCTGGTKNTVRVANKDAFSVTVKNDSSEIRCVVEMKGASLLFCPIEKDTILADAVFLSEGSVIARLPLYATEYVAAKEYKKSIWDYLNIFQ